MQVYPAVSRDILTLKNTRRKLNMSTSKKVRFLALGAVIAALYAVLTYVAAAMNLAYGAVQFRFSEALTVLPVFTPAAIPGLALGCLIANLGSPLGVVDWVFGTGATLIAAVGTWLVGKFQVRESPSWRPCPLSSLTWSSWGLSLLAFLKQAPSALEISPGQLLVLPPFLWALGAGGLLCAGPAPDFGLAAN